MEPNAGKLSHYSLLNIYQIAFPTSCLLLMKRKCLRSRQRTRPIQTRATHRTLAMDRTLLTLLQWVPIPLLPRLALIHLLPQLAPIHLWLLQVPIPLLLRLVATQSKHSSMWLVLLNYYLYPHKW